MFWKQSAVDIRMSSVADQKVAISFEELAVVFRNRVF
jgi:hypothetical protein